MWPGLTVLLHCSHHGLQSSIVGLPLFHVWLASFVRDIEFKPLESDLKNTSLELGLGLLITQADAEGSGRCVHSFLDDDYLFSASFSRLDTSVTPRFPPICLYLKRQQHTDWSKPFLLVLKGLFNALRPRPHKELPFSWPWLETSSQQGVGWSDGTALYLCQSAVRWHKVFQKLTVWWKRSHLFLLAVISVN